jgi:hypothetical protein
MIYTIQINKLNCKKNMTYDIGNQGLGLGQTRKYGGAKPVNGAPTLPSG